MSDVLTDLLIELLDLWSAERCEVKMEFDESAGSSESWTVLLVWVSEWNNPHQADWAEYTWNFYGETLDEALGEALEWAKALLPLERCGVCDGRGWWGGQNNPAVCEGCTGSGLAHD